MSTNSQIRQRQYGITLTEIIIVVTVLSTIAILVFTTFYDMYLSNISSLQTSTQTTDTRTALRSIEDSLTLATDYAAKVSPVTSPQGPNNDASDWDFKGTDSSHRVLISKSYATTAATSDNNRALVYHTGGCGNPDTASLAKNTYIYFVRNQTLYRRTITPTGTCSPGPFQKSTCAPGQSGSVCQASDAVLLTNVTSFVPEYYVNSTDASPIDVYNEPNDAVASAQIAASKAITVTVQTTQSINGIMNTYQSSIRINKFN